MCLFSKQKGVAWFTKEFDLIFTRFTDVHALVTCSRLQDNSIGLLALKPKNVISNIVY